MREEPAPARTSTPGAGLALVADDRDWIDRIRRGDRGALEALFRSYVRPLTAFANRYVQSISAAQEVVREAYARLWQGRHSWAFHGSLRGYLFAATHRVALEVLHRTHRESRWHAGLPPSDVPTVRDPARDSGEGEEEGVSFEELEASVAVAIARLPGRLRTVAFMRWSDRLTREEIATVLGTNARTVHSQLTPAARSLRKRLGSPCDIVDAWSPTPSTREATDEIDRFASIDPERLEHFLAGECIPAEEADLEHDVAVAGGEPRALDAMRSAWRGSNRAVEQVVDGEAAWQALARRIVPPTGGSGRAESPAWRFPRLPAGLRISIPVPSLPSRLTPKLVTSVLLGLATIAAAWTFATRRASDHPPTPAAASVVTQPRPGPGAAGPAKSAGHESAAGTRKHSRARHRRAAHPAPVTAQP